jgi:hypothetical protein
MSLRAIAGLGVMVALQTVFCAAQTPQGTRVRVVPRDEAARAPGFGPVIARFRKAVQSRNAAEVLAITSQTPAFSFADGGSRAGFRKYWQLDDPKSEFWTAAERILAGGSAVVGDCADPEMGCTVTYPYWLIGFPADLDPVDYEVVAGDNVPAYSQPRAGSAVLARLSYDVVRLPDRWSSPVEPDSDRWTAILLPDGREAFIDGSTLYSAAGGHRMMFNRRNNGPWMLTAFIAGD